MDWEDVDAGAPGSQQAQQAQHWRERAAARQRYWSMSHGFQMGRKLAAWGEQGEQGQAGEEAGGQEAAAVEAAAAAAVVAAAGAGGGLAATPPRKKGLIGEPGVGSCDGHLLGQLAGWKPDTQVGCSFAMHAPPM